MENEIGETIRRAREANGWSQEVLAEKAGTKQQTVQRIESGQVRASRALPGIFAALGLQLPVAAQIHVSSSAQAAQPMVPGASLVGAADLPIYASVVGGSVDDAMTVTAEIIDYVKRPEPLANAKNGYGLYVIGTSMVPVYRPGDLALVHPNLPAAAGDDVIICGLTELGEHYAMIKHLVRATPTKWRLRQYNPAEGESEEFELDRAEWPVCHTVVGVYRKR